MKRWMLVVTQEPTVNVYPKGYFPRAYHYHKDALLTAEAIRNRGEDAVVFKAWPLERTARWLKDYILQCMEALKMSRDEAITQACIDVTDYWEPTMPLDTDLAEVIQAIYPEVIPTIRKIIADHWQGGYPEGPFTFGQGPCVPTEVEWYNGDRRIVSCDPAERQDETGSRQSTGRFEGCNTTTRRRIEVKKFYLFGEDLAPGIVGPFDHYWQAAEHLVNYWLKNGEASVLAHDNARIVTEDDEQFKENLKVCGITSPARDRES